MSLLPTPAMPHPVVWTVAGSDSCGGAGVQADLRTFQMLGVHSCSAITAITAQNSFEVRAVETVSPAMLAEQLAALQADMPPKAIKIGMLGDAEGIAVLAKALDAVGGYVVCDPVLISSSGTKLLDNTALQALKKLLLPRAALLTPNVDEAEALTGTPIKTAANVVKAAQSLRAQGAKAVVIKGFDSGKGLAQDYYDNGQNRFWLSSKRREGPTARGTGCSFAAAIAASHALGIGEKDSIVIAKAYVNQCLRLAQGIGRGMPILTHAPWPCAPEDYPWLTRDADFTRAAFPDCGNERLGFYPVVDSLEWLKRLLPLGVKTAQLRIKNLEGAALEEEIRAGIELARTNNCRLFINDYWRLAIKHKAYGVHLGQEDLATADIEAIREAGLRLGLSTHCHAEAARAHAIMPSYMAIGPVFPTTLKAMNFAPQGAAALRHWRAMLDYPLVAIGGITLERAAEIRAAGADSIAVVSDVTRNADPEARAKGWLDSFKTA